MWYSAEMRFGGKSGRDITIWNGGIVAAAALCLGIASTLAAREAPYATPGSGTVQGRFLVANPSMPDRRFARTVILMVRHDETGAFGLVINKPVGFAEITDEPNEESEGDTPEDEVMVRLRAHYGGPVEPNKAFVIHSPDYRIDSTVQVTRRVAVTADPRILEDITDGNGPKKMLYIVGYSGWGPGQLENEIRRNDWYTAPVEAALIFGEQESDKSWKRAMEMRLQGI